MFLATVSKHAQLENLYLAWPCLAIAVIFLFLLLVSKHTRHTFKFFFAGWRGAAITCVIVIIICGYLISVS